MIRYCNDVQTFLSILTATPSNMILWEDVVNLHNGTKQKKEGVLKIVVEALHEYTANR